MGETYYDVLEVDADATRDEIEAAYRERVLETHPDHNDSPDAAEQFKRVSTAKSVLTDGDERARYDRLGHDAYVRLGEHAAGSTTGDSSGSTDADDRSQSGRRTASGSSTRSGTAAAGTATAGTGTGNGTTRGRSRSTGRERTDGRSGSHHARQRKRRQRKTRQQRAAGSWSFESGDGTASTSSSGTATDATRSSDADESETDSGSRYAVHDWEDDVDLEWDGESLDHTTAVTVGCIWLLYPVFIAASLTSAFPFAVNATVAACTLALVGYLLTKPRIAAAVFGSWSLLLPVGMAGTGLVAPVSIVGLVALGSVWVPFAYALGLWWVLRP